MIFKVAMAGAVSVLLLKTAMAPAQHKVLGGARVLMLSGGQRDHHGYRRQSNLLQRLLEDTGQFQVTICEDAAVLETPAVNKYDVVIAMADRRDPEFRLTTAQQQALLKFVHDGKGFFSFHAFCCADKDWVPEMRELLGGVLAHFGTPDTKVQAGRFFIRITNANHPITRDAKDFEHSDELYYYLQTQGDLHPLAVAVYEGKDWPVLWTRSHGQGKVCVSVFGHCGVKPDATDPLEHAPFRALILKGIAWTAGQELKRSSQP
jgi:type 1 glutamine amidotransferase